MQEVEDNGKDYSSYTRTITAEYSESNARQLREALDTQKNELNFGYQKDLRDEQARLEWFFS
jgi:hypothetical protein